MSLLHALEYTERGWVVIPMRPESKLPMVKWKGIDEPDTDQVVKWWTKWPQASIGVLCGPSRLVVVDVDDERGLVSLPEFPETAQSATGRGGWHLVYTDQWDGTIRNSTGRVSFRGAWVDTPGVDIRAKGGLFVAPPSLHKSGRRYEWVNDVDPQPAPLWLTPAPERRRSPIVAGLPDPERLHPLTRAISRATEGERNNMTFWAGCRAGELVAAGAVTEAEAFTALCSAAEEAGLPPDESEAAVNSGIETGLHAVVLTSETGRK